MTWEGKLLSRVTAGLVFCLSVAVRLFLCWWGENWRHFSDTEEAPSFPQVRLFSIYPRWSVSLALSASDVCLCCVRICFVSPCRRSCHDLSRWSVFELLSPLLSVESGQGAAAPPEVRRPLPTNTYKHWWFFVFMLFIHSFSKITVFTVPSAPLGLQLLLEVLQCLCYFILWSLNTSGETLTSRVSYICFNKFWTAV